MPRPSTYSYELAREICERLHDGRSLLHVCKQDSDMPSKATACRWINEHWEFKRLYVLTLQLEAHRAEDHVRSTLRNLISEKYIDAKGRERFVIPLPEIRLIVKTLMRYADQLEARIYSWPLTRRRLV